MENQQSAMVSSQKMMPIEELFKKSFLLYYHKAFAMLFLVLIGGLGYGVRFYYWFLLSIF